MSLTLVFKPYINKENSHGCTPPRPVPASSVEGFEGECPWKAAWSFKTSTSFKTQVAEMSNWLGLEYLGETTR